MALAALSWSWAARPVRLGPSPTGMAARVSDSAPRAVRSAERLWGLPDFSKVEIEQVVLGNALLRIVILFLAAARVYGFAAIMEHPQLPSWAPGAPSSWKLQELVSLSCAGGMADVHLDQCCCGAPWKKPTRLFAVGVPGLARLVSVLPGGGCCSRALGHVHVSLFGKGEYGFWRIAPAKTCTIVPCVSCSPTQPSVASSALFTGMPMSWLRGVVCQPTSRSCTYRLTTTIRFRGWRGHMIVPGHFTECGTPVASHGPDVTISGCDCDVDPGLNRRLPPAGRVSYYIYIYIYMYIYIYIFTYISLSIHVFIITVCNHYCYYY